LVGGRLTPYKRNDLAVLACTELGLPLRVFGDGPDRARLQRLSGPTVTFLGQISDEQVVKEFAEAEAYIFPLLDDFGVVGIESLAAGTPIIAYHGGGALDYVLPGKTGLFFDKQTAKSLAKALASFDATRFSSATIANVAQTFSPQAFESKIKQFIKLVLTKSQ
jgi:glycosyltransferase involved in cell wall biosynthesis